MLQKLAAWLDEYREVAFDLVRIYLGVGLFARGVLFVYERELFMSLLPAGAPEWLVDPAVMTAVALIHIIGGIAIAIGFWTRLATLLQIPVLFGAVFLSVSGMFSADQSFQLSSLVLFLLVLVLICGSGRWSVDHYIKRKYPWQQFLAQLYALRAPGFDMLRMYLGIALFIRGTQFIADANSFFDLVSPDSAARLQSTVLLHYVALTHIFGGFMMTAGLLTRVAALIQVPVLVGALIVTEVHLALNEGSQGFELAALTLFLLILIFLYGPGTWSSDHYLFRRKGPAPVTDRTARAKAILMDLVPEEGPFANPVATFAVPEARSSADAVEALRKDPTVVAQARYSIWGWALFLADVTPRPREIVFRDVHSGSVLKRSKDPDVLDQFRYR